MLETEAQTCIHVGGEGMEGGETVAREEVQFVLIKVRTRVLGLLTDTVSSRDQCG
jgi:hypothetical protein